MIIMLVEFNEHILKINEKRALECFLKITQRQL